MTVTDITRYNYGARDDAARQAATLARKRHRVTVARSGPQMVDAGPTRRQLLMLHRRMSWYQMEGLLPTARGHLGYIANGKAKKVTLATANAVEALWVDFCGPLERDRRRWPIAPFKSAALARYGTIRAMGNINQARQIWSGRDISTKSAENYADSLGLMPSDIWPDWYSK